jgi:hypothetical protein
LPQPENFRTSALKIDSVDFAQLAAAILRIEHREECFVKEVPMRDEHYEAIRQQVVRRFVLRATFFVDLAFFLLILLLMLQDAAKSPDSLMGIAFFVLIWGTGLLFHAALAFNIFGRWIDRATRRQLERDSLPEKPKRQRMELSDDGELIESDDQAQIDEPMKRAGRS